MEEARQYTAVIAAGDHSGILILCWREATPLHRRCAQPLCARGKAAQGKIRQPVDGSLNGAQHLVRRFWIVLRDIVKNAIQLCKRGWPVTDRHTPCFANSLATSASLASSPRRAAASSASNSARSICERSVGGRVSDRARSEISSAMRFCWSSGKAEASATAACRRLEIWFMGHPFLRIDTIVSRRLRHLPCGPPHPSATS